jgi:hypothetical protein
LLHRSLATKVKKLQEALDDRKLAFNAIAAKNALLEADLTVATQQYHDAQNEVKKVQIEKEHLKQQLLNEYKKEKEVRGKFQSTCLKERFCLYLRNCSVARLNCNAN